MKKSCVSFALVLLIEAFIAVITFLQQKLMRNFRHDNGNSPFGGSDFDPEYE